MKFWLVLGFIAASIPSSTSASDRGRILRRVASSAVVVSTEDGMGSGTIITRDSNASTILTCFHVIKNSLHITVWGVNSNHSDATVAVVEAVDEDHDLALLYTESPLDGPPLPIAKVAPRLYDPIYIVGNPMGQSAASEGILADKNVQEEEYQGGILWRVTGGLILFGVSGGTGTNIRGELVCVPNMVFAIAGKTPIPQIAYCIPLQHITKFLKRVGV